MRERFQNYSGLGLIREKKNYTKWFALLDSSFSQNNEAAGRSRLEHEGRKYEAVEAGERGGGETSGSWSKARITMMNISANQFFYITLFSKPLGFIQSNIMDDRPWDLSFFLIIFSWKNARGSDSRGRERKKRRPLESEHVLLNIH